MTEPADSRFSDELEPGLDPRNARELDEIARLLAERRPAPPAALRARIRADIGERPPGGDARRWRPRHPARLAVAYAGSGFALLAVAALGVAGAGPLS